MSLKSSPLQQQSLQLLFRQLKRRLRRLGQSDFGRPFLISSTFHEKELLPCSQWGRVADPIKILCCRGLSASPCIFSKMSNFFASRSFEVCSRIQTHTQNQLQSAGDIQFQRAKSKKVCMRDPYHTAHGQSTKIRPPNPCTDLSRSRRHVTCIDKRKRTFDR